MNAHRGHRRIGWRTPLVVVVGVVVAVLVVVFVAAQASDAPGRSGPGAAATATRELAALTVAAPVDDGTYKRALFATGKTWRWADLDHDGCNTREEIMARDLQVRGVIGDCNVVSGTLHDPYTGKTIVYRETESSTTVQIDHIYPLALAWREGAEDWTRTRRVQFANDPVNLLAVSGHANESKGDSGPGEWTPTNTDYECAYAEKFIAVAAKYQLPVTQAGHDALALSLQMCPTEKGTK